MVVILGTLGPRACHMTCCRDILIPLFSPYAFAAHHLPLWASQYVLLVIAMCVTAFSVKLESDRTSDQVCNQEYVRVTVCACFEPNMLIGVLLSSSTTVDCKLS